MRIEERLRRALRERAASVVDNEDVLWDGITARLEGRRPPRPEHSRHRLLVAAVALIIGLTPVVLVARTFLADDSGVAGRPAFDTAAYGTYRFRDIEVRPANEGQDRDTVNVAYVAEWTMDRYPGEHECTWMVHDAQGQEIGSKTSVVLSASPVTHEASTSVSVSDADLATTASINCDPERLDTPVAYGISNERVKDTVPGDDRSAGVEVAFDVSWPVEPPAYPGLNQCTVALGRPSGDVVATQVFQLIAGRGTTTQRVWRDGFSDPSALEEAARLIPQVNCEPFTGTAAAGLDSAAGNGGNEP